MRPIYVSQTGTGTSVAVQVSRELTPINIGLVVYTSGTVNYTVNYTYDDVSGTYPNANPAVFTTPIWLALSALSGKTSQTDSSISFPVSAVQLVVNSGAGTAMLAVLQAGRSQ